MEAMRVVTEDRLRELQRARIQEAERQAEEERQRRGEAPPAIPTPPANASIWTTQDDTIMQTRPEAMRPPAGSAAKSARLNPAVENSAIWKLQDWQQDLKKRTTGAFRAANVQNVQKRMRSRNRTQMIVAMVMIAVIVVGVTALGVYLLQGIQP